MGLRLCLMWSGLGFVGLRPGLIVFRSGLLGFRLGLFRLGSGGMVLGGRDLGRRAYSSSV